MHPVVGLSFGKESEQVKSAIIHDKRLRLRPDFINWDNRVVLDEEVLYRTGETVVFTRPRCPATNTKRWKPNYGQRCSRSVAPGYPTCPSHQPR